MFSFRTTPLLAQEDIVLKRGRVGVFCNQTAWDPSTGDYLFEALAERGNLKRVFSPAGEFPGRGEASKELIEKGITFSPTPLSMEDISDLEAIIIELQDTGCRYSPYPSCILQIFDLIEENKLPISVYIVDRINPSGRQVEGTPLTAGYRSIVGIEGLPNRHGLTIGEVANYIYTKMGATFPLHIISYRASVANKVLMPWSIPISQHFAGFFSSAFYSGGFLWRGTNVSFGVGTQRPYEIFGAPFMADIESYRLPQDDGVYIRRCTFTPASGAYEGVECHGYQLLLKPMSQYNSVAHTLRLMRCVKERCKGFIFGTDTTDPHSDRTTIEQLIGDKVLIDFVRGKGSWDEVQEHIKSQEQKWIKRTKKFLLYEDEPLYRVK